MAVMFTNLSWWLWGGKVQETTTVSTGSSLNSSMESVKFASNNGVKMRSASRKIKRKWHSREERRIDREYDAVLVPSDGGFCLSGSESDDSDWSIGWMEPHAPDFQSSDDETESSFAVLVPCYDHGRKELDDSSKKQLLHAKVDIINGYSADGKGFLEQWLSSLQNSS